jgi:hypothetical protein
MSVAGQGPATPVFVLGRHRSGTTWVANIVASLPGVFAVQHAAHRGVHESAFFSHLVPHCHGGRTESDLREIKRLFEKSDYFLLTGLTEGPDILRHGYAAYFRHVMQSAAAREGARYWLEKTPAHTLHARFLSRAFPGAILLAVVRDPRDVVASNLHGFGDPRSVWAWFRQAMVTAVYERIVRRAGAVVVRYEDLCADYRGTVASIARALGLEDPGVAEGAFERNTSYASGAPRPAWWQTAAVRAGGLLVKLVPGLLLDAGIDRWRARKTSAALPDWFFLVASRGKAAE